MKKKRLPGKSAFETVEFKKTIEDMCRDYFLFYLYLCWTPPKILNEGIESFCNHWEFFRVRMEVSKAIIGLEKKGYIRCHYGEDGKKQIKIIVLKRLATPVNDNFAFFYQKKKASWKPLQNLVIDPFDDPKQALLKQVKPGKKTDEIKHTISANKQTVEGHKKQKILKPLYSVKKGKKFSEILKTFSLKKESSLSSDLIPINVKNTDGVLIKQVFMKSENIKLISSENKQQMIDLTLKSKKNLDSLEYEDDFVKNRLCKNSCGVLKERNKGVLTTLHNSPHKSLNKTIKMNEKHSVMTSNMNRKISSLSRDEDNRQKKRTTNIKHQLQSTNSSRLQTSNIDSQGRGEVVDVSRTLSAGFLGLQNSETLIECCPSSPRKAKKGSKVNLEKVKTQYVNERKARVLDRQKKKNLSEEDVWEHIKHKSLDIFSPQIDRSKLLAILDLPKKSIVRKELIAKLGESFSDIYYAYRHKIAEATGTNSSYSKDFGNNTKHAEMAAEACIRCGVTPQFVVKYFHEIRSRFSSNLRYIPLTVLSNASMIDSAASAYLGDTDAIKHGNEYEEIGRLHPFLRQRLEEAGFDTQEYSDNFLMTVQVNAENIAEGFPLFVSSDIKEMVHWAAKNVFSGK